MATRAEHANRPNRKSLSCRLGKIARQIKARDNNACVYCGGTKESTGAHLHLDHVLPRVAGGADVAANLVLACARCNSSRKDLPIQVWATVAFERFALTFSADSILAQAALPLPTL